MPPYISARPKTIGSPLAETRPELNMLSTNVVRANAARPSGPGAAIDVGMKLTSWRAAGSAMGVGMMLTWGRAAGPAVGSPPPLETGPRVETDEASIALLLRKRRA